MVASNCDLVGMGLGAKQVKLHLDLGESARISENSGVNEYIAFLVWCQKYRIAGACTVGYGRSESRKR